MVDVMFINNKYKSWYDSIIQKAKVRNLSGYKEKHHILPRCLGGKDTKTNLVKLTAREHFIVHMLLCKFTKGQARIKMLYAFNFMSVVRNKNRDYKINSKIAQKLRLEFFSNKPKHTFESKLKMSRSRIGMKLSKETRKKVGLAQIGNKKALGLKHSEETKNTIRNANKGNKHTLGMICINKNGKTIMIQKDQKEKYLDMGYKLGKLRSCFRRSA
tara:strand:+ start:745 stop:1389 length:645 start_codon:yes stop_codon:yes gene_type:complete